MLSSDRVSLAQSPSYSTDNLESIFLLLALNQKKLSERRHGQVVTTPFGPAAKAFKRLRGYPGSKPNLKGTLQVIDQEVSRNVLVLLKVGPHNSDWRHFEPFHPFGNFTQEW
jgi:hypothetical protein